MLRLNHHTDLLGSIWCHHVTGYSALLHPYTPPNLLKKTGFKYLLDNTKKISLLIRCKWYFHQWFSIKEFPFCYISSRFCEYMVRINENRMSLFWYFILCVAGGNRYLIYMNRVAVIWINKFWSALLGRMYLVHAGWQRAHCFVFLQVYLFLLMLLLIFAVWLISFFMVYSNYIESIFFFFFKIF